MYTASIFSLLSLLLARLLILLNNIPHTSPDTLIQTDKRLVTEPGPRLRNAVVLLQRAVPDLRPCEVRRLAQHPHGPFREEANHASKPGIQMPHRLQGQTVTRLVPDRARKVPEVDWLAVGDEESLAVHALGVNGHSRPKLVRAEESENSEDVAVCYVLDVCEVEQVVVKADLVLGLSVLVCLHHLGKQLYISLAENACGSNGAGKEALWLAVSLEDGSLSIGLCVELAIDPSD